MSDYDDEIPVPMGGKKRGFDFQFPKQNLQNLNC